MSRIGLSILKLFLFQLSLFRSAKSLICVPCSRTRSWFPSTKVEWNCDTPLQQLCVHQRRLSTALKLSCSDSSRRSSILFGSSSFFSGIFGGTGDDSAKATSNNNNKNNNKSGGGRTNEVIKVINGIRHRRLGGSDVLVSELGLGTQRWCSTDFNAPNEQDCFNFMDEAILKHGVNLIDTAEQYPIPSNPQRSPEGTTETVIGKWMKSRSIPRSDVIIATKITGGRNVTPQNLKKDCEGSLKRLGTDYIDVYQVRELRENFADEFIILLAVVEAL
jgi:hypothetical protein